MEPLSLSFSICFLLWDSIISTWLSLHPTLDHVWILYKQLKLQWMKWCDMRKFSICMRWPDPFFFVQWTLITSLMTWNNSFYAGMLIPMIQREFSCSNQRQNLNWDDVHITLNLQSTQYNLSNHASYSIMFGSFMGDLNKVWHVWSYESSCWYTLHWHIQLHCLCKLFHWSHGYLLQFCYTRLMGLSSWRVFIGC